jgi:hypothetical protein
MRGGNRRWRKREGGREGERGRGERQRYQIGMSVAETGDETKSQV